MSINVVTVYVPASTDVIVKGFSNSDNIQRITVTPPGRDPIVLSGHGQNNMIMGRDWFTSPAAEGPVGVGVSLEFSPDSGATWVQPNVFADGCTVHAYNLTVVVAEDMIDEEYNDAICMLSWAARREQPTALLGDR